MKVAILIDWFLPGNKAGGPVRSVYSLIKALQDKIDFYVVTMNTDITSSKEYAIKANEWVKYEDINVYYFSENQFSYKTLMKLINTISADLIYINSFWSYKFSVLPLILKKSGKLKTPIVLAPRGMLETGAMNIKSLKKKLFLYFSRMIALHKHIVFHATSQTEKKSIQRIYPTSDVFVVSNLSYSAGEFVQIEKKKKHLKIFFLSRISPVKNLYFALNVLSQMKLPTDFSVEYDIYGNNEDKNYLRHCKEISESLPENIKCTYKGVLSFDEVAQIISQYHFLFLPTKNENFGHAIVETLNSGRPVLISNCTPWNEVNEYKCGLALSLNEHIFREKILEILLMNNEEYQQMCANAQTFIITKLDKEKIKNEYLNLFEHAAKS